MMRPFHEPGAARAWLRLAVGAAGLLAAAAQAQTVTLVGSRFDVSFDAQQMGVFGAPTLSGDTLSFLPSDFKVESLAGQGEFVIDQTITLTLTPHAGQTLQAVVFGEQGQYRLSGQQSDVSAWGELRATPAGAAGTASGFIAPNGYFGPGGGVPTPWSASGRVDFSAAAGQAVAVSLQNALQAYTRPSDVGFRIASIETAGALTLAVSAVPEPATWALWLSGAAGLAWRQRPRQAR